jgi:hypothetical protein
MPFEWRNEGKRKRFLFLFPGIERFSPNESYLIRIAVRCIGLSTSKTALSKSYRLPGQHLAEFRHAYSREPRGGYPLS